MWPSSCIHQGMSRLEIHLRASPSSQVCRGQRVRSRINYYGLFAWSLSLLVIIGPFFQRATPPWRSQSLKAFCSLSFELIKAFPLRFAPLRRRPFGRRANSGAKNGPSPFFDTLYCAQTRFVSSTKMQPKGPGFKASRLCALGPKVLSHQPAGKPKFACFL